MADIKLKHINKTFDKGVVAVSGFDLEIKSGEFLVIVGPSGCGKSTVLRMIAGLEQPSAGDIYIGGKRVNDTPPQGRDVAMVFQDHALYPNLTVYDNLALGLKLRKVGKAEIDGRVRSASETLGITGLLGRKPSSLSGGEKQRAALGRVLVRSPKVFLLDEPLSGIDAKFRAELREEIKELHRKTGITFVCVTHDQTEAMTMGDRIVVMQGGRIVQTDTPAVLYRYPDSVFTATFIGMPQMNIIPVSAAGSDITLGGKTVKLDARIFEPSQKAYLGVRPEHIVIGSGEFEGALTALERTGNETVLYFSSPLGRRLIAVTSEPVTMCEGQAFKFDIDFPHASLFDGEADASIAGIPHYNELPAELDGIETDKLMARHLGGPVKSVAVPPDGFILGGGLCAEITGTEDYPAVSVCMLKTDGGETFTAKLPRGGEIRAGGRVSLSVDQSKAVLLSEDGGVISAKHIEGPYTKISLTPEKGQKTLRGFVTDMEFAGDTAVLRISSGREAFSAVTDDFSVPLWIGSKIKYAVI